MIVRLHLNGSTPERYRGGRALRWAERLLLACGVGALGYYGYVHADTWLYQKYEGWALDRNLAGKEATAADYLEHVLQDKEGGPEEVATTARPRDEMPLSEGQQGAGGSTSAAPGAGALVPKRQDKSLIGRIEIPRVQVAAVVREGVDDRTLRRAVGHVPGTALPGKPGNVALAGHRDTFFTGLRSIRKNDRIQVKTLEGEFEYEVDSIRIVTPKEVGVIAPTKEPALTLVTCYPFNFIGSAPKRYIVRAKQVTPTPSSSNDVIEAKAEHRDAVVHAKAAATVRNSGSGRDRDRAHTRRVVLAVSKTRS